MILENLFFNKKKYDYKEMGGVVVDGGVYSEWANPFPNSVGGGGCVYEQRNEDENIWI